MKLKLGTKIILIFFNIIVAYSLVICVVLSDKINAGIKEFAVEKTRGDLNLAYSFIDAKYPGQWAIKNNQLYKGSELMNDNAELINKIAKDSNDTVTLFQGDIRVATNVMIDGKLAIGTKVSNKVSKAVIDEKETYYGEAVVGENTYQTAYKPLLDRSGEVVGIFYMGASEATISNIILKIFKSFLMELLVALGVALILIRIVTKSIKKRLNNISQALKEAGTGKFTAVLHDESGDELSDVSENYNRMTINMKELIKRILHNSSEVKIDATTLLKNAKETEYATENALKSIIGISENVELQQQMIEHNTNAINDMTSGIMHVTNYTLNVANTSQLSIEKVNKGRNSVEVVVNQMEVINQSSLKINHAINELANKSKEINKSTHIVTANSETLIMLTLAIENRDLEIDEVNKALAEVKKLAEQSHSSAQMIAEMVKSIQHDTEDISQWKIQKDGEIQKGLQAVKDTGTTFNEIYSVVESSYIQIQELSATSEQMSASMQEINASCEEIASLAKVTSNEANVIAAVSEEQVALTVQVKESAEKLTKKAEELKQSIAGFEV